MKINKLGLVLTGLMAIYGIKETQAQRPFYSKGQEITQALKRNEILIRNKKSLPNKFENHEDFIKKNIFELEKIYGKEECLKMINIHFLIEINKYRKINGKKTVILDDKLQNFSQNRAKYLFENGILEHGKGEDNLANRLNKQKIDRNYCGENLGAGQMSIESIIKARIKSDNHNELLLNDNLENIGIGIIRQEKRQKLYSTRVLTTIGKFN